MPVPIGFFRNKNFTRNQRGALKIDAIFATDDAEGTEPFQGWLADATVVDSFNDALIENRIGVVDTENFNLTLANRFAFTTMSEGRRLRQREVIFVEFSQPIVLDDADPVLRGDDIEFRSNGFPFGSTLPNSNGNCYRIFSVIREKSITIEDIVLNGDNTATIFVDDREDLTAFNPATSTGNNYTVGGTIVVEGVSPTDYNGSYTISAVNLNEITIDKDNATPVYNTGGEVYLASNKLLLTEVNRARVTGASFVAGVDNIQIGTATIEAEAKIQSGATITAPGIGPAATPNTNVIASYNSVTKTIDLSFNTSSSLVNGTLLIEQEAVNNIPIPSGAFVSPTAGFPEPLVNAGQVTSSRTVKIGSEKYYVYGDSRLKYFWSTFTNDTGATVFDGFEQNVDGDNFLNQFVASNPALGQVTTQLIGNDSVFASEDTFNNLIKTLGTNRSDLAAVRKDYTPQSGAALLYISATDSQGETGGTTRKGLGTTVPAYSVTEAVEAVRDNLGYWVGVIGGSFSKGANNSANCQNEIQPFLQNSSDGILGDPRGFIPIVGEVTSIRVGVPIDTISYDVPSSTVTCTTYYDHQYGAVNDELRIRIKNSDDADLNGLKDITVTGAKTFTFIQQDFTFTAVPANWDSYGYGLNITDLLTVPTGFYRKSQIVYTDVASNFNDSRATINRDLLTDPGVNLAFAPGGGAGALERKELLITVFVTETEGTLQFFDAYAFGNFFVGLPTTDSGTEYYFAYPTDGKDIKFALAVDNLNTLQRSIASLLDAGTDTVAAGTEFDTELYAIEHTADVVAQDPANTWIEVLTSSIALFDNKGEGRDFTNLDSSGSGYNDGVDGAVSFSGGLTNLRGGTGYTVNAANVAVTGGSGTGLTVNYASDGDAITSVSVQDQGEGYLATDTDLVITGGDGNALIDIASVDTPKVTFSADDVATTATTGVGTDLTFDISVINGEITNVTINNRGTGYAVGDTGEIEAVAGATAPTVKATYSVKSIDTSQLVELSFETTPPGTQLAGLSSRTGIVSIVDSPSSPGVNTRITLNKTATDNNVGREVSFIAPGKNRIQKVFVKNSNNFKDIDVKPEAQEPLGEVPVTSDASITFSGYGYSIGDVLTPSDVTNPPASVANAVWTFDTKIAFDGFVASGLSPEGTISDVFVNLAGDESGTGASFRVTQSSGGFYNVELLEQGFGFTPGEEITIPGYAQALDGLEVPDFVTFSDKGTGGTPGDYTNITITPVGAETGINVTLNFTIDDGGEIIPSSVTFNTDETSTGFRLGDEYDVTGGGGFTSAPRFIVQRTPNDITIRVTEIEDNSNVTLTTTAPHGFTPPLGRTAVDIFVENVESLGGNALNATGYNGRFSAEVVDGVTLVYQLSLDPGTYDTSGTVYNVSIDVINDTFAAFNNKLFWNINAPTNDPVYPYIRRVSTASIVALDTIEITTTEPHGLLNGDEVRISGLVVERERDWDLAKVQITTVGVGDPSTQFRYTKSGVSGGAAVSYITGGEVTNPYVKVLGGVYTKDFNRIVFVNTTTTEQDSIPPDKTQDFFVRQINLKQIANDGFEVKPGSEHNFYVTGNNELSLTRRTDIEVTRIEYIPLTLEYELTCNEPHGLWVGNRIELGLTVAGDAIVNNDANLNDGPAAYESPAFSGQDPPEDLVSTRISDTVFRIKTFLDSRAPVDNPGTAGNNGDGVIEADGTFNPIGTPVATFVKEVGDPEIFQGVVGGFPQDIVQFTGLSGSPGISTEGFYYIINEADENDGGITSRRSFQISRSKTGGPISFFVNIAEATYNRTLEIARIEVPSATPHGLQSGDNITITGVASDSYNGTFVVDDILSEIAFTYSLPPIQGSPDTTAYAASRVLADTAGAAIQKRCNFDGSTSPTLLALRNNQDKVDIIPGMLAVGTNGQTNAVLNNGPHLVTGFSAGPGSSGSIVIDPAGDATQSIGGGGQFFEFQTGVTNAKAVEIQGNVDLPNIINGGQLISPVTATAFDTDTYVVSVYFTSAGEFEDIPTDDGRTTFNPATDRVFIELSKPLIGNLTNGQTFDLIDNDSPSRSIRVTAFTEAPKVGDEIVNTDLSNNQLSTIQTGTTIQSVVPYDLTGSGGLDGFILELSSALLSDVTTGLLKIYPASPVTGSGQITGVQATLVGGTEVIDNQNTTIAGQVRLTADITGWDHVTLAENTGGALFFQLGYPLFCTGTQGSSVLTVPPAQNFTNALVDLNDEPGNAFGYGAYGDGVFQGSVISSINLGANQITLDSPLTRDVNNYVGFARPNSVSIFPKYTQEFGRILGKTFAEWLFKIA